MKSIKFVALIAVVAFAMYSFTAKITQEEWKVPAKYEKMKNPTNPADDKDVAKSLYKKHCAGCHGNEGYGDGPKAGGLKGNLGDFSSEEFQSQSDGALFYKTSIGRGDMPGYEKKLAEAEDRWLIVNYMRTLAE